MPRFIPMFWLVCLLVPAFLFAQETQETPPNFQGEFAIGGGLHTGGFNLSAYYALIRSDKRSDLFILEFSELKHPKERRQRQDGVTSAFGSSNSYLYGKRNNLYALRLGVGQRYSISDKKISRATQLSWQYQAGLNLGLLKPYYLELAYRDNQGFLYSRTEPYTAQNANVFLDPSQIEGPGGFQYGWSDLDYGTGLFLKTSLWLDWGEWNEVSKSLELGLAADVYFRRMPIMILQTNDYMYFNLFLNVHFGGRW